MRIHLSEHFTYGKLLRFVLPPVVMMVFTSIYSVVDGLFVSNFAGKIPFAALNLVMPFLMILSAAGLMFGAGGAAIVGKTLGEGKRELADEYFSLIAIATATLGIFLGFGGCIAMRPLAAMLGAKGEILNDSVMYGRLVVIALPFDILQKFFYNFFSTAEKPKLGLWVSVGSGFLNIALDALFLISFGWGLWGAAVATGISQAFGAVLPLIYFARKNDSLLRLSPVKKIAWRVIGKAVSNGSSEMVSNIALALISMLYNYQLLRFVGENGVAAYGVVMYLGFFFVAVFFGYALGASPVVSYNFGAKNDAELKNIFRKSLVLMTAGGAAMSASVFAFCVPLSRIFVGYDAGLYEMTVHVLSVTAIIFLLSGINIFGSSFFTALNDGLISAAISFLRTGVFEVAAVLALPLFFGVEGVWWSIVVSELAAFFVTLGFLWKKRKVYHYM